IRNSTLLICEEGRVGRPSQWSRCGSTVLPSSVDAILKGVVRAALPAAAIPRTAAVRASVASADFMNDPFGRVPDGRLAVSPFRNLANAFQRGLMGAVDFATLGPLAVTDGGQPVALGGPKQRALLAILLLHANESVSRDRLIDGIWGEQPPDNPGQALDTYVSRMRKALGSDRIERRGAGYAARVEPGELDVERFETLANAGRFAEALAIWRGPALGDLVYEPFAQPDAARLEERRLGVLEERIEADLEAGAGGELVPELAPLVRDHPLRERLLAQLMLALYRAGRHTAALEAYRRTRRTLAEELGLEPGPQLRELERRILAHDP